MRSEMTNKRPFIGAGSVEMPDLSDLVGRNLTPLVTFTMVAQGTRTEYYVNALVRMTERAAYSYEQARSALTYAASDLPDHVFPLTEIIRGTDYLEIALNALLRAQLAGERLRRDQAAPRIEKSELLSKAEATRLRNLRHFSEHLDKRITAGQVGRQGVSPITVRPLADGIEFAGDTLLYSEVAKWIVRLESLARRLVA